MKPRLQALRSDINFLSLALNNFFTRSVQATTRKDDQEQVSLKQMQLNLNNLEKYFKKIFLKCYIGSQNAKKF